MGASEVSSLQKVGVKKVLAMLKGGGGRFYAEILAILKGGHKKFHSLKGGGAKSFPLS